jgi:predicted lactoylglutathione lyase
MWLSLDDWSNLALLMGIEAIDHLYIQTQDFDDSIAFWQALGYKKITEWNKYPTRGCRLEAGETFVVLAENTLRSTLYKRPQSRAKLYEKRKAR